jgi:DNA polymerase-3 subunit epsilon
VFTVMDYTLRTSSDKNLMAGQESVGCVVYGLDMDTSPQADTPLDIKPLDGTQLAQTNSIDLLGYAALASSALVTPARNDIAGVPLHEVTFVIVDLETTGATPANCGITEIGAVKVRAGEKLSDFRTFCNPGMPIPEFITEMTGITQEHVRLAPEVPVAVREFLVWANLSTKHDTILVAHNAPFDVGFLEHACTTHDILWPEPPILDTLRLARKLLDRDEVADKKLSTLASHFNAPVSPTHRALDDAMATVTVLHALIERVAGFGVHDSAHLLSYEWPSK